MPQLYDPDITKYSTPGDDAKWTLASFGIAATWLGVIALILLALL